jgi:hypothetical protein
MKSVTTKGATIVLLMFAAALDVGSGGAIAREVGGALFASQISAMGNVQTQPGAPGGRMPIDKAVGTAEATASQEGGMGDQAQLLAQAGAIGILAVVLFFYRRDFFTKDERQREKAEAEKAALADQLREQREDRDRLEALIAQSNTCITNSAVAMARQTDATHRLARTVEVLQAGVAKGPAL